MKTLQFHAPFWKRANARKYLSDWVNYTLGAVAFSEIRGDFTVYGKSDHLFQVYNSMSFRFRLRLVDMQDFK